MSRADYNGEWWVPVIIVDTIYRINNRIHSNYNKKQSMSGYIYNQNSSEVSRYRFGFFSSSHNGCGWIATYNALIMLDNPKEPYEIISYYERKGALFCGAAGIFPTALAGYFKSKGYSVKVTAYTSSFDRIAKTSTANVLFYFHKSGAHNIALRWNGKEFIGYNTYADSSGVDSLGTSIQAFLEESGFWGAVLTSIK